MAPRTVLAVETARLRTAAFAASSFAEMGIVVSIFSDDWRAVHLLKETVASVEVHRRRELSRWAYNEQNIALARSTRRPVLGNHAGFFDLFVPVVTGGRAESFVVAGPFAREWPSATDLVERWHAISRERANLGDPDFHRYLALTLATLTLEGPSFGAFESLLQCFAQLLGGQRDAEPLERTWDDLTPRVLAARAVERMWEAAHDMVDDRTAPHWRTAIARDPLRRLGLPRPPVHVLVGLVRAPAEERDAIDAALRRYAFQRALATFARKRGGIACGRVGDHGITLLSSTPESAPRARTTLIDLAAHAARKATSFGLRLHAGIAVGTIAQSLAARYRAALAAADQALARGASFVVAQDAVEPSAGSLAQLRTKIASGLAERPDLLPARFQRYIDAVVTHTNYQHDAARAHLQLGLERFAEPWLSSGQLDAKTFEELSASIETVPRGVGTIGELLAAYQRVVTEIERSIETPTEARQARSVERALRFMRDHLADPLTLAQTARVARFAPSHFARLLKREQRTTFGRYLATLRLERAKHMLSTTDIHVGRIAEQSGFASRTHFQRIFRARTGLTPVAYRKTTRMIH